MTRRSTKRRFRILARNLAPALAIGLVFWPLSPVTGQQPGEADDGDPREDPGAAPGEAPGGDDEGDTRGDDEATTEPEATAPDSADPAGDAEGADDVDIDELRERYLELRDRLFESQARAQAVASALYSTELRVHLDFPSDRFVSPTGATIRLNGATIYEDSTGDIADDRAPRFEGFVAPGPHRLTVAVKATHDDDPRFETASEHTFTVVAPRGKRVTVRAEAGDDGDIGYEWDRSQSGSYELALDVEVDSEPREATQAGHTDGGT